MLQFAAVAADSKFMAQMLTYKKFLLSQSVSTKLQTLVVFHITDLNIVVTASKVWKTVQIISASLQNSFKNVREFNMQPFPFFPSFSVQRKERCYESVG